MKSGGFKSKGGGFRSKGSTLRRKAPTSVPEGISRTKLGQLQVRDPGYMKALHAAGTPPLDLSVDIELSGVMDLHHPPAPVRHSRPRDFDSGVAPLDHNVHMAIEAGAIEQKAFGRVFPIWGSFRYWCYKHGRSGTPEDAQAFNLWTLEKLEEEQNAESAG